MAMFMRTRWLTLQDPKQGRRHSTWWSLHSSSSRSDLNQTYKLSQISQPYNLSPKNQPYHLYQNVCFFANSAHTLVSYPSRWSFFFILGPLHWSSSWQWQPCIAGCRFFQTLLWTELADFAQFFCKMCLLYMWRSRKICLVWFGSVLPPQNSRESWL